MLVAEQGGENVGSVMIRRNGELRWTVSPRHRGKGLGKRMVALVAEPGHIARIDAGDVASQKIASHAGFDLVQDGHVQLWRADRAEAY
jgi:RimJ/RimL family protein N-acetyltransferase